MEKSQIKSERTSPPVGSKYVLDSGGVCFFCLNFKEPFDNPCEGEEGINQNSSFNTFSLRSISRFLRMDPKKLIYRKNLKSGDGDDNIVVNCCQVCSSFTEEFKELYILFEETKMYLMACVKRMREVIKLKDFKDELFSSKEAVQKGLLSQSDEDLKLMSTLREEMVKKCELKLRSSTPKVIIEQLPDLKTQSPKLVAKLPPLQVKQEPDTLHEDEIEDFLHIKNETESPTSEAAEFMEVDDDDDDDDKSDPLSPAPETEDEPSTTLSSLKTASSSNKNGKAVMLASSSTSNSPNFSKSKSSFGTIESSHCPHCDRSYTSHGRSALLNLHIVHSHVEHLFPHIKIADLTLTTSDFKTVISQALNHFIKNGECSLCAKRFNIQQKHSRFRYLKTHLIQKHYSIVAKKIIDIQDKMKGDQKNRSDPVKFVEEIQLPKNSEWLRNFFLSQSERAIAREKKRLTLRLRRMKATTSANCNNEIRCPHCNLRFSKIYAKLSLRRHLIQSHEEHFFPKMKRPDLTTQQFRIIINQALNSCFEKETCSLCNLTYSSKAPLWKLKSHLLQKHQSNLEEKLNKIQNDPNQKVIEGILEEKSKPENFQKEIEVKSEVLLKSGKGSNVKRSFPCPLCNRVWKLRSSLQIHLYKRHRYKCVSNARKDHVTLEQFKFILDNLIFKGLISINEQCSLCNRQFPEVNRLFKVKVHIFSTHREVLLEKLEQSQEDAEVMKKVLRYHFACDCGAFFEERESCVRHRWTCEFYKGEKINCDDCGELIHPKSMEKYRGSDKCIKRVKHLKNEWAQAAFSVMRKGEKK